MYSQRANPGNVLLTFVNQLNYFYQCIPIRFFHVFLLLVFLTIGVSKSSRLLTFLFLFFFFEGEGGFKSQSLQFIGSVDVLDGTSCYKDVSCRIHSELN